MNPSSSGGAVTAPKVAALLAPLILGASLALPSSGWSAAGPPRAAAALAALWLFLNFFVWMPPAWRAYIVTTRGPLLGFGFAFAGALVTSAVDGLAAGWALGALLFWWRFFVLSLPFALALARRRKPYPHWSDLAVLAFAWLLPHVPGFSGSWFGFESVERAGIFRAGEALLSTGGSFLELGPGRLLGLALLATYFYGARAWSAAPLDWMLRENDLAAAARMAAAGTASALLMHALVGYVGAGQPPPLVGAPGGRAAWAFFAFGLILAPVAEELTFRGIVQSGIPKIAPKGLGKRRYSAAAAALVASGLHALAGSFGLSGAAAFGLSLGISALYPRKNRLLPAVLAHAAAFALLALASSWL